MNGSTWLGNKRLQIVLTKSVLMNYRLRMEEVLSLEYFARAARTKKLISNEE